MAFFYYGEEHGWYFILYILYICDLYLFWGIDQRADYLDQVVQKEQGNSPGSKSALVSQGVHLLWHLFYYPYYFFSIHITYSRFKFIYLESECLIS